MRWESTRRRESEGDGEQEMRLEANKGDREEETVEGGEGGTETTIRRDEK